MKKIIKKKFEEERKYGVTVLRLKEKEYANQYQKILEEKWRLHYPNYFKDGAYRYVKFVLDTNFSWAEGWNRPRANDFDKAILDAFTDNFWEVIVPEKAGGDGLKGNKKCEKCVFHKKEIVAEINENTIGEIVEIVNGISEEITAIKEVRIYEKAYPFVSEVSFVAFMMNNRKLFSDWILKAFEEGAYESAVGAILRELIDETHFFNHFSRNFWICHMAEEFFKQFFKMLVDSGDISETFAFDSKCSKYFYKTASF